jgi:uncharacterized protein (TIGR00251 family)
VPGSHRCRLRLRVTPGAARSGVVGRREEVWKVRVRAPAERGRANEALVELLAAVLEVPRGRVNVVSGRTARDKVVEIEGLTVEEAERRLAAREGGR